MSEKILIYDKEEGFLDVNEIESLFRELANTSNIRVTPQVVAAVEAHYQSDAGICVIRLISSRKAISLEGTLEGISPAISDIASGLNNRIHLIDQAYTFDLPVERKSSAENILQQLLPVVRG